MLDVTPWIDRIKTEVLGLKLVAGAANLAGIKDGFMGGPAAWVIPLSESAERNEYVSAVSQRVTARIGVVLAVRSLRDPRGDAARADLTAFRAAISTALLGWAPDGNHDPTTFARGQLLALTDSVVWWQDEYQTAYYLTNT